MARILWLDDRPAEARTAINTLKADGHDLQIFETEEACVDAVEADGAPDLMIQDLNRPGRSVAQVRGGPARTPASKPWVAGWRFYEDVLRAFFPQLPVVICTEDSKQSPNHRRANDYNLVMVQKGVDAPEVLRKVVDELLASQRTLHVAADTVPHIVSLDFGKVTEYLIKHLASHPADLDKVGWVTFESLVETLLREMQYEVHHTPLTRDGGVDLWAIKRTDLGDVLYAIDTKKYGREEIVGPEPVRAIYGVTSMAGASVGMIVTTARFGPAARALANQYRYRLALKEFEDIVGWMRLVSGRAI